MTLVSDAGNPVKQLGRRNKTITMMQPAVRPKMCYVVTPVKKKSENAENDRGGK